MGSRMISRIGISGLLLLLVIAPVGSSLAHTPQNSLSQLELLERAFIRVAEEVKPAVVNISTMYKVKHPREELERGPFFEGPFKDFFGEEFFERFFKNIPRGEIPQRSLGSGLIVSPEGYILTNNHVVEKAQKIEVRLSDKTKFRGEVVGRDPKTDIAVIKIDPKGHQLAIAKLGDSNKCRVGQWAIAIGNPFGLDRTVTVGVISATGRSDIGIAAYENFIQTDASINRGNSGGPLVNIQGEVIGINTAIVATGQGIGFAVPINMARDVMEQLIEHGEVIRGWMGIAIQKVTEELAKQFGVEPGSGVLVGQVFKGDPADKAGIKVGDIITKFDGTPVTDPAQLSRLAAATPPNKKVEVVIIRDKQEKTLTITMGKQKEEAQLAEERADVYGMRVQELTPQLAKKFGITEEEGVLVSYVKPGGPAGQAGIRTGDLIVEVNRQQVTSLKDYERIISAVEPGEAIVVLRIRNGNSLYVVIEPEEETSAE
jgi:serine protease Do